MVGSDVSSLSVLALSDSLSQFWPAIASECGLGLLLASDPDEFHCPDGAIGVICAAGVEDLVEPLLKRHDGTAAELAVVGANPDHRLVVAAILAGAVQYFVVPQDNDLLRSWVRSRAERAHQRRSGAAFARREAEKYRFEGTFGRSPLLRDAIERAARIIPHPNVTVLITGETGTGKELLARAIHYNGPRSAGPFVDVNCVAMPDQLLESELFGHEKGAFTGATSAKPGLFEVAHGGTLFLDEIGHLSLPMQGKLLRALEQRVVRRVGGTRPIPVDVRIVSATHVDLAAAVRRQEFREDLLHRLNVIPIELPPLRARREDLLPLARHFLARFAAEYGVPEPSLTRAAARALELHPWAGNVRELRNVLERVTLLGAGGEVDIEDLGLEPAGSPLPGSGLPFPATLEQITRAAAGAMTELCDGNKSESARRLGISRTRLLRILSDEAEAYHEP
ncbi:MAG: sigma-54-dependent Fis family transcriptional regulator [Gemmatimonadales bacterium]|nr:sigma-54-dependent Fis family transcriptional regulator [Gemmatimonadales bacterium]